jgi:hypothetical protein
MGQSIKQVYIPFKCECMQDEGMLALPERGDGEDILVFMNRIRAVLSEEHTRRSPQCHSPKVEYIKIPMDEQKDVIGRNGGGTA